MEVARQTPALKKLERVLREPYSFEPLPPMLHYGYAVEVEQLQDIAAHLGYTREAEGYNRLTAMIKAINHITGEVIEHPAKLKNALCEGEFLLVVSLCTNWEPSERLDEVVPKLKEYLGETEDPMWYLDWEQWFWRT